MKPFLHRWIQFFVIFLILSVLPVQAQQKFEFETLPDEESRNLTLWYEQIEQAKLHPIAINTASEWELQQIPGIRESLVDFLISYRRIHGYFQSKKEVKKILNLSEEDWRWFSQFITVKRKKRPNGIWLRSRLSEANLVRINAENTHSYQRLLFQTGPNSFGGVLLEKDPLEKNWADHAVGYFKTRLGRSASLLLGDYFLEFGQGLVFGLPYTLGKSALPDEILKKNDGIIRGDGSSLEEHFLRGGVATLTLGPTRLWLFASRAFWDARIDSTTKIAALEVTVPHAGAHLFRKKALQEKMAGTRIQTVYRNISLGMSAFQSRFANPVVGLKNQSPLKEIRLLGIDFKTRFRILKITGEWAHQTGRGNSFNMGAQIETKTVHYVFGVRHYAPDFWNPHGFVFGEQGTPQNEKGWYSGFLLRLNANSRVASFLDVFIYPKISSTVVPNAAGKEWSVRWWQKWASSVRTFLNLSAKQKMNERWIMKNGWNLQKISAPRRRVRLQFVWWLHPSPKWDVKGQVQSVRVRWPGRFRKYDFGRKGFLFTQELKWRVRAAVFLSAGWALFQTDSYGSRIYAYEPALPGQFTVKMFYGRGTRLWLRTKWKIFNAGQFSIKYSLEWKEVKPGVNYRLEPEEIPVTRGLTLQLDINL